MLGQVRSRHAHALGESRIDLEVAEDLVEEVVDDPAALGLGEAGELVHLGHLLGGAVVSRREQRDVSGQAQNADLRIQGSRVRRGDVGEADLAIEHACDRRQVDAEVAQGAHERHLRDGAGLIEAVATLAARRRDDEAAIGIEAQRRTATPLRCESSPIAIRSGWPSIRTSCSLQRVESQMSPQGP